MIREETKTLFSFKLRSEEAGLSVVIVLCTAASNSAGFPTHS